MNMIPRRSLRLLALVALTLLLGACAGHAKRTLPAMTATPAGTAVKQPAPQLYVTGQPAEADWRAFADAGIGTVINLRTASEMKGRDERAEVSAAGMRYFELPINGSADLTSENARRLGELLSDARGPVLLHCASGNRAGGMLALLKAGEGMPAEQALAFGRSAGMASSEAKVRDILGLAAAAQSTP